METFGEYLKAHREKKGIRLEEIASITKIHLHSLELIETNQWNELPPDPFLRGFISAYAKYVGLEPKDVLARFYTEIGRTPADTQSAPLVPADGSAGLPGETPSKLIEQAKDVASGKIMVAAGLAVVTLLTAGIIYVGRRGATPSPETVGEVASANTEAAAATDGDGKPLDARSMMPMVEAVTKSLAQGAGKSPGETAPPAAVVATSTSATAPTDKKAPAAPAAVDERKVASPVMTEASKSAAKADEATKSAPSKPAVDASTVSDTKLSAAKVMETEKILPVASETKPETAENVIGEVTKENAKHEMIVEGNQRTWIKYVLDDKSPVESFLKEKERITFRAKEKIKIVLGNSTGSKVSHNGEEQKGVKFAGTIRIYKFPRNARFPQDKVSKRAATVSSGDTDTAKTESSSTDSAEAKPEIKTQ